MDRSLMAHVISALKGLSNSVPFLPNIEPDGQVEWTSLGVALAYA